MNTHRCIFFIIMILFLLHYMKNNMEGFIPNEKQFSVCSDNSSSGETYYQLYHNNIYRPLEGLFSSIINTTEEHDLSNYFKPPQCYGSHQRNNNYFNDNKIIDISNNTWEPLKDAHNKYYHPDDNYAVIYSPEYIDNFLEKKTLNNEIDERF